MKAIVVYESLWGNTAAIARAIAAGIGPEAQALSTAQAAGAAISDADLIVAGAPVLGFGLPSDTMLKSIGANAGKDPVALRRRSHAGWSAPDTGRSPRLAASS
jgi:flavodoxin